MSGSDRSDGLLARVVDVTEDGPLAPAIAAGFSAFVGGYALFVAVVSTTGSVNFGTPLRALKQLGFLYYNAQNVPLVRHTEITFTTSRRNATTGEWTNTTERVVNETTFNLLQQVDPTLPTPVYYAIPVVVGLGVATWLAWRHLDGLDADGASLVVGFGLGYVLAAAAGTFLVVERTTQGRAFETLSPSQPWALAFGAAYALVVATVAVLGVILWRERRGE